jgi:hypothetical protein
MNLASTFVHAMSFSKESERVAPVLLTLHHAKNLGKMSLPALLTASSYHTTVD